MKKILIFLLTFICLKSFSQSTLYLRGDTIRVYKQGGTAVLKVDSIIMLTKYRQGASTDSVITWNPTTKLFTMRDAATFGSSYTAELPVRITGTVISADTSVAYSPSLTTNARLQKIADSLASLASGTINSGTTGKPAYYTGATTLDDFAAVDYATSGTNVKITTQATTDVGLEIKLQSSQTANALNISSSGGTGDLASITKDGYLTAARVTASSISATHVVYAGTAGLLTGTSDFIFTPTGVNMLTITGSNSTRSSIMAQNIHANGNTSSYWQNDRGSLSTYAGFLVGGSADAGGNLFGLTRADRTFLIADGATSTGLAIGTLTVDDLIIGTNNVERMRISGAGAITVPEQSAPSTPSSATVAIYPKSDGLWYGKDDAGLETRLSNTLSGLVQSKGLTLESPTSAEDFGMWKTQVAITVSSINAVVKGSSPSVTINIAFGSDITSLTNVFSAGTAITNTTTGQTVNSGFNDATIPAGSWIRLISTASSGTITQIEVTINYTED